MLAYNVCIWKVEKDMDEIPELLTNSDFQEIAELKDLAIGLEEKHLYFKWENVNGIREQIIDAKKFRYISASTLIEKGTIPSESIIVEGKVIPKANRVNKHRSVVLFVESLGQVYCIVRGSKSLEGSIRSKLFQSRKKDSQWGRLECRDLMNYTFDKSFYYWLIKQKGTTLTIENKEVTIREVKGFKCNTERKVHSYNGEGTNIDQEIPLRSIISMDETLVSLYIKILCNNITYSFYLDYDSRLSIIGNECGEFATQNLHPINQNDLVMELYFDLIPFLRIQYNKALQDGWENEEKQFRKDAAIITIMELMTQNELAITDLES